MKRFYLAYSDEQFWQQPVAKFRANAINSLTTITTAAIPSDVFGHDEAVISFLRQIVAKIPWGQNILILNKIKEPLARLYYICATAGFGWSRSVLLNQIKASAYERSVVEKKTHNFHQVLPVALAKQADEMLKSRYNLEFLGIAREVNEREIEDRLIARLQRFILELGYGFCFIGRQYRLTLGHKEYFVDLLFYHRYLKALVAFELKVGAFEPEHAGKMDFYLNLLNEKERGLGDQPPIGIILCAEKDDIEVGFPLAQQQSKRGIKHSVISAVYDAAGAAISCLQA